jgi:hypothetical protein
MLTPPHPGPRIPVRWGGDRATRHHGDLMKSTGGIDWLIETGNVGSPKDLIYIAFDQPVSGEVVAVRAVATVLERTATTQGGVVLRVRIKYVTPSEDVIESVLSEGRGESTAEDDPDEPRSGRGQGRRVAGERRHHPRAASQQAPKGVAGKAIGAPSFDSEVTLVLRNVRWRGVLIACAVVGGVVTLLGLGAFLLEWTFAR